MPTRSFPSLSKLSVYAWSSDRETEPQTTYPTPQFALLRLLKALEIQPIVPIQPDVFDDGENGMFVSTFTSNPASGTSALSRLFTTHNGYVGMFSFDCMPCDVTKGVRKKTQWNVALQLNVKVYGYEPYDEFNKLFHDTVAFMLTKYTGTPFKSIPLVKVEPRTTRLKNGEMFKLSFVPSIGSINTDSVCEMFDAALRHVINTTDRKFFDAWGEHRQPPSQVRVPTE
jgi:hypothetical protein